MTAAFTLVYATQEGLLPCFNVLIVKKIGLMNMGIHAIVLATFLSFPDYRAFSKVKSKSSS